MTKKRITATFLTKFSFDSPTTAHYANQTYSLGFNMTNNIKEENHKNTDFVIEHTIDAKGLKCPMPVIKLQQQVRITRPGKLVLIECTDPGAEKDIGSWCRVNKHALLKVISTDTGCQIIIKTKADNV